MVAYSFKKRFAEPILTGTKAQTIRADRKRHARPGEELQLYTGMRTKHCRLIGRVPCIAVERVHIEFAGRNLPPVIAVYTAHGEHIRTLRTRPNLDGFARADGFHCFTDMAEFWAENHPGQNSFGGILIRWSPLVAADPLDIAGAAA